MGRGGVALRLHVLSQGRALPFGMARAARPSGALSRGAAQRSGPTEASVPPRGDAGGVSGRRRVRWDEAAGDAPRVGRVLCVPHGPEHGGDGGRRGLSPRYLGRVEQARHPHGVTGGAEDP